MLHLLGRVLSRRGTSFTTPSDRHRLRTLLGVTPLEDRTVPTAVPLTGPNGGAWVKIDTITVATKTNPTAATGVQSNVVLDAGVTYLAVASGSARIATDATGFTDAEFIRYNQASGPQDGSSPGYAWNNHGVRLDGVDGGNTTGNFWGAYQADHQYVREVTGQGTLLRGWYSDIPGYYGDNSGTLQVDLYAEVPANNPPIGSDDWSWAGIDTTTIHVLDNDTDPDGDALTIIAVSDPIHGDVSFDGSAVAFTPVAGFEGTETFTYTVSDGRGGLATATVTVSMLVGELDELVSAQPPKPPAPKPPTSDTLTWADYNQVDQPPAGKTTDANTAWNLDKAFSLIKWQPTLVNTMGDKTDATATVDPKSLPVKWTFVAVFDKTKSYVVKGKDKPALLSHEKLHLQIAEYIAEKALANAPDLKDVNVKLVGLATKTAKAEATKALSAKVSKIIDDYEATWKKIDQAVTDAYDANDGKGTDHGTDPKQQADWEKNYKKYADVIAKNNGWTK